MSSGKAERYLKPRPLIGCCSTNNWTNTKKGLGYDLYLTILLMTPYVIPDVIRSGYLSKNEVEWVTLTYERVFRIVERRYHARIKVDCSHSFLKPASCLTSKCFSFPRVEGAAPGKNALSMGWRGAPVNSLPTSFTFLIPAQGNSVHNWIHQRIELDRGRTGAIGGQHLYTVILLYQPQYSANFKGWFF